jgi:hypothetical protein
MASTTENGEILMQQEMGKYDQNRGYFNQVRARCLNIIHKMPGLTTEQIRTEYYTRHNSMPEIDNRLREARELGWITNRKDQTNAQKLHWWPVDPEPIEDYGNNPAPKQPFFKYPPQKPIIQEKEPEFYGEKQNTEEINLEPQDENEEIPEVED